MTFRMVAPLDPACPAVVEQEEMLEDPMTVAYGIGDEVSEHFTRKHRGTCKRCQEYGAANINVE